MWWRYAVGVVAGLLLALGGVLLLRPNAVAHRSLLPAAPATQPAMAAADDPLPEPPAATEKTREQKRFSRYDHDKNGAIARDEYLAARRKAFAKLDKNGDGRLDFDEWAAKAETKFAGADADHDGKLTAAEFATTRVVRKAKPRVNCPPVTVPKEEEG